VDAKVGKPFCGEKPASSVFIIEGRAMTDQQSNELEQRIAALERRLKVSQFMSIVFCGFLVLKQAIPESISGRLVRAAEGPPALLVG